MENLGKPEQQKSEVSATDKLSEILKDARERREALKNNEPHADILFYARYDYLEEIPTKEGRLNISLEIDRNNPDIFPTKIVVRKEQDDLNKNVLEISVDNEEDARKKLEKVLKACELLAEVI